MELDGRGRSSGDNNGGRGGARPNRPGRGSVGLGEGTEETRGEVGRLGARGSKARRRGVAGTDRRGERRRAVALLRSRAARGRGRRRENGFGHRNTAGGLSGGVVAGAATCGGAVTVATAQATVRHSDHF